MLGLKLFQKSLSQVYYNVGDAFKLTGLLYLIMTGINVIITYSMLGLLSLEQMQGMKNAEQLALTPKYWLTILVLVVINVIFTAWVAVLWHRYMLLAEGPETTFPAFKSEYIWGYITKSLVVGVVLIAAMIPALIVMVVVGMMNIQLTFYVSILVGIYLFYISMRIGLILPARAIDKDFLVSQSWNATGSASLAVLTASILLGALTIGLQTIPQYLITNPVIKLIVGACTGWIVLIIGVSILTTLYGYLVEGRSLD